MKALTIIAHGSRAEAANSEFQQQVEAAKEHLKAHYSLINHCFLELAEPSMTEACEALVEQGATSIDVYPLFFNQGRHVMRDIPALVDGAQQAVHPTPVRQFRYFGAGEQLAATIANDILNQAQ